MEKSKDWCEKQTIGTVKWIVDPEDVVMFWYINFYNEDDFEKEVHIEITKVWKGQNVNDWI